MLLKIALGLLAAWGLGLLGLFSAGDLVHLLLLCGLMLLLVVVLQARDEAIRRESGSPSDKR